MILTLSEKIASLEACVKDEPKALYLHGVTAQTFMEVIKEWKLAAPIIQGFLSANFQEIRKAESDGYEWLKCNGVE